jgi:WS/DGAT/MGAT family acyltransferase
LGATVNDIIMAVCAGGLRSYLLRHNALPADSLIAGCPVSMRKPGDTSPGNQVSMMNVELATQIADPLERLSMIRASAKTAKEVTAELAGVYEPNAAFPGMPSMMNNGINAVESFGLADFFSGPINVVISNAFGPRATLYSNGARMMSHHPVSIVAQGIGVNITVQSYVDQVYLGLTACAKAVPDADLLRDDLIAAFEELKARLLPQNLAGLKPKAAAPVASANQEPNSEVAVKVA